MMTASDELELRLKSFEEHKNRQIDENRAASRKMDKLEERIAILESMMLHGDTNQESEQPQSIQECEHEFKNNKCIKCNKDYWEYSDSSVAKHIDECHHERNGYVNKCKTCGTYYG